MRVMRFVPFNYGMILTDDDDDDDEGGRARRPRLFPPLFVVSNWIYPSTACTNLFTCLPRVLHNYILYVHGAVSHHPAVIRTLRFPLRLPLPFSTHIYSHVMRRRPVSSTQVVFFYLNHNDILTRVFSFAFSI